MIFIGERINAGFKDVRAAIVNHDGDVIKEWAVKQTAAKADYLEVAIGTASNKPEDLCWMIEMVQSVCDTPISIDINKPVLLKEAIKICKKPPLVNSTTAIEEKMNEIMPIVAEYNASVIGLVMDEEGSPKTVDKRIESAGKIMAKAMDLGITPDRLFLDPIIMPLKFMQDQHKVVMNAVSQFTLFSDPPCHIVCGLTNASNGAVHKKLINRVLVAMLIAHGLDAVILDVLDEELVNTILTADLIMNRSIYADSYLEAFRK
ncbi:MAG: dihydropteroate synthase [Chitinivibrionales bacterium]|nr:dihydropteroate synthase [Chitinivibrionales bacterium]